MISLPAAIAVAYFKEVVMALSNQQVTNNLPLTRLVTRALSQLEKLGYSRRSLRRYRLRPAFGRRPLHDT